MSKPASTLPGSVSFVETSTAAEKWAEQLWALAEEHARDLRGNDVVALLAQTSTEVWGAGLDLAFHAPGASLTIERGALFDVTWLSVFLVKLAGERSSRS